MVNPELDDKDRVLGKTEKGKEQLGGTEFLLEVRKQERRRLSKNFLLLVIFP